LSEPPDGRLASVADALCAAQRSWGSEKARCQHPHSPASGRRHGRVASDTAQPRAYCPERQIREDVAARLTPATSKSRSRARGGACFCWSSGARARRVGREISSSRASSATSRRRSRRQRSGEGFDHARHAVGRVAVTRDQSPGDQDDSDDSDAAGNRLSDRRQQVMSSGRKASASRPTADPPGRPSHVRWATLRCRCPDRPVSCDLHYVGSLTVDAAGGGRHPGGRARSLDNPPAVS
jgi:hypothetical protein